MKNPPLSADRPRTPPLCAVVLSAMLLVGCASQAEKDVTANWSPNKLYAEAIDERNAGNYDRAIQWFEKLEGRAAGTPLAQQAQLEKAYTHYKNGEQPQAIATLERFIKLHPASPALDYALYLKGLVNFNDNLGLFGFISQQDLSERDQKAAKDSFEAFKELVERFPDSRYAPDARQRMVYIVNSLAQYEVHVARYYYRRGAFVAAINRAQTALKDYQNVPANEEALYILMKSYEALDMQDQARDARRVLETNFPSSAFLTQGFRRDSGPWWKLW
ncbi:MAG: outer membrane protein assembly factor BamD [Tepidimonas sp.]|uniref:outer membrane protein assembly factor BamD n=1 Tax=Tepidimonas sp. TaxID=2002775 RepID=UPI0040553268